MPKPVFHTSSLNVLSMLICPEASSVIVFDPGQLLIHDESFSFTIERSSLGLLQRLETKDSERTCLFNLSKIELTVPPVGWLVEFNGSHTYAGMKSLDWSVINNPDGSPRWIYPSTLRKPGFLAFYNFNYWKATLYKFLVKTAFFLRIPVLIRDNSMTIHHRQALHVETLASDSGRDYAIFTGTAGPNRKIVVAEGDGPRSFLKTAVNHRSATNIENEYNSLCLLRHIPMKGVVIPKVSKIDNRTIRLSNIKPLGVIKDREFGPAHGRFLRNLFDASFEWKYYRQIQVSGETHERLRQLASHPRLGESGRARELFDKLVMLENKFQADNLLIGVSMSHGDFTPWNVYATGDTLCVYDWELCRQDMPVLFDLFHYVIQGKVFSVNASAPQLQAQIYKLLESPVPARVLREQGFDPALYLRLYLLHNATYYLELYLSQASLQANDYRLFSVWSDLLGGAADTGRFTVTGSVAAPNEEMRKTFVRSFFRSMLNRNYTVLKSAGKSMQHLAYESDLDILIARTDRDAILEWIRQYPGIAKLRCTKKSFMTTLQLFFADQGFLSIDLLTSFHRKSLEYIPAESMLRHSERVDGVRHLLPAYDYLYIYLFYQLNFSDVPPKYSSCFEGLSLREEKEILEVLRMETGIIAARLTETFAWSKVQRQETLSFLRGKRENRLSRRLQRYLRYGYDRCRELFRLKGIMLSFSGVDGAGKSTILGEVRDLLEKKYRRKVVVLRHRPSILPILSAWKYGKEAAEQKCVESLPRKGNNNSGLSSALRFSYYYTDYLLGQFLIYVRYMLRGYVVLYDRYFFDFVVDGKRSNIRINSSFVRQLYRFVYKPQLNIFLYASPEIILKRKQELSAGDILQLTTQYKVLFHRLGNQQRYVCIENMDKQATIDRIEQAYIRLN